MNKKITTLSVAICLMAVAFTAFVNFESNNQNDDKIGSNELVYSMSFDELGLSDEDLEQLNLLSNKQIFITSQDGELYGEMEEMDETIDAGRLGHESISNGYRVYIDSWTLTLLATGGLSVATFGTIWLALGFSASVAAVLTLILGSSAGQWLVNAALSLGLDQAGFSNGLSFDIILVGSMKIGFITISYPTVPHITNLRGQ